jgi:hydrogenase maturation protease
VARGRILVAGVGNVFLGDDGFGVEVARRLASEMLPNGVIVRDVGIRTLDLAYEMAGIDALVLIDAVSRGGAPGTVYVLELDTKEWGKIPAAAELHGLDPALLWGLAAQLGARPAKAYLVACEVESLEEFAGGLSAPVARAVDGAIDAVRSLVVRVSDEVRADA